MRTHWGWVSIACLATSVGAQESSERPVDALLLQATELNRSGDWKAAAALAEQVLDRPALSDSQRARALYTAAYGRVRTRDIQRAQTHLSALQVLERGMGTTHWIPVRAAELRAELAGADASAARSDRPEDGFWRAVDAEHRARLNDDALTAFDEAARRGGADAYLLVHEDRIVAEWRSERYAEPMTAMSSTKSVTSLLVGMLIDRDAIAGLEQKVGLTVPEWREGPRGEVTVGHLLSHTSGLENRARRGELGVGNEGDKNAYVIGLELDWAPGERFSYSNEGVQLLSPILDAAAGEPIQDFAQRELFEPLGMRHSRMKRDRKGHAWTYADLETTPRDLARIGLLMQHGGEFRGRRIVSAEWVARSVQPGQEHNPSCGLLWWLFDGGYAAQGYLGTDVHVLPAQKIVAVRMQRKPGDGGNPGSAYRRDVVPILKRLVRE